MNDPADYLFAIWDGGGNVGPELALARGLVERGHRVRALAGPPLQTQVEATGATFLPWERVPHRRSPGDPDPFVDHDLHSPARLVNRLLDRVITGPAALYAAEVGAALDDRPAGAVVASFPLLGALAAAEARALGRVAVMANGYLLPAPGMPPFGRGWSPAYGRLGRLRDNAVNRIATRLWARGTPTLNTVRSELGLAPLPHLFDQIRTASRILLLTSSAFDFPAQLPPNARYVGPQLDDPPWADAVDWPPGDDPLVLVAMSSTFMDQAPALRRCADALTRLPVRALVTTGPEIDPDEVPGTDRVRVVRSAPHLAVLQHTAVVINHGGHGTVVKSLLAGVPQLVIPLGRDQPDNAARVIAAGAGLRLRKRTRPAVIASAVRRLLDDPDFRFRAEEIGTVMRTDGSSGSAFDELEALAVRSHDPTTDKPSRS